MKFTRKNCMLVVLTLILVFATQGVASAPVLPNPVLYLLGQEYFTTGGKKFVRYRFRCAQQGRLPRRSFRRISRPAAVRKQHTSGSHMGRFLRSERKAIAGLLRSRKIG